VLSHDADPPRNQGRTALRDVSSKKSSLTHWVDVRCLPWPVLAAFSLLLSTANAEEQYHGPTSKPCSDKVLVQRIGQVFEKHPLARFDLPIVRRVKNHKMDDPPLPLDPKLSI
jgi:hypothetical protein